MIITEGTTVNHAASNGYPHVPRFYGEDALAGWKAVVEAVHGAGGKIVPQLWHVGNVRRKGTEPEPDVPGYGPMEKQKDGQVVVHGMTKQDIQDVIEAFAQAARDAQAIGMDGVEIHGAHGYLIDQFFWEGSNQRTDEYGGSWPTARASPSSWCRPYVRRSGLIFRSSSASRSGSSRTTPHGWCSRPKRSASSRAAGRRGVDIFHCSTRRFWEPEFEGSELNLAGWTRQLTGKPTITVGSVGLDGEFLQFMVKTDKVAQPANIEGLLERLNKAEFDLVAVGRALICDPEWAVKVREGRMQDILPFSREALKTLA